MADAAPRWLPGQGIAIVWPTGMALVEDSVGLHVAERIWTRLRRDPQLGIFLKALSEGVEGGFLDLPQFAIVVRDGARWHIAARGDIDVEAQFADRVESFSGAGITTWAERILDDPASIRIGAACADDGSPIADGVLIAGGLVMGEQERSIAAAAPKAVADADADADVEAVPPVEPVIDPDLPEAEPAQDHEDEDPDPDSESESVDDGDLAPAPPPSAHTTYAGDDDAAAPEEDLPPSPAPVAANPYDSLWDRSIALDVEAAAIRDSADDESDPATPAPDDQQPPAHSGHDGEDEQLIGDTVADAGVVQVQMPSAGPSVLARFCDRGHANPPERADCFVCGAAVAGDARMSPRPQLGWLRVEGGETIPLRGPIVAGRNPRSTAIEDDQTPRLLALPHPHVSSTHLAIVIEGWRLLVKDLNSSNGTFLRRQGEPPVRLPESAVPLVPGDLIDLGKGLFLHLEKTP